MAYSITIHGNDGHDFDDLTPTFTFSWESDIAGITFRFYVKRSNTTVWAAPATSYFGSDATDGGTQRTVEEGYLQQYEVYTARAELYSIAGGIETLRAIDEMTFTARGNQPPTASIISPVEYEYLPTLEPEFVVGFTDPNTQAAIGEFDSAQLQVIDDGTGAVIWDFGRQSTTTAEKQSRTKTFDYGDAIDDGAPALSSGANFFLYAYVWDGAGARSARVIRSAGVAVKPAAPDVLEPDPGETVNTLTPTFIGDYNQGTAGPEGEWRFRLRRGLVLLYTSGWITTPIGDGFVYGTSMTGDTPTIAPVLAWDNEYNVEFQTRDTDSVESDWSERVTFRTNRTPLSPLVISPTGNPILSTANPTLVHTPRDPDGDAQINRRYWVWNADTGVYVSGYNPKEVAGPGTSHTITQALPVGAATRYMYQIATEHAGGPGYGPRSDPESFTIADAPTVTITSPLDGAVFASTTIPIAWTFSSVNGAQDGYTVYVYDLAGNLVVSFPNPGSADLAYTITSGNAYFDNGETYRLQIGAEDQLGIEGRSPFVSITISLTPPAGVTGLQAEPFGGTL